MKTITKYIADDGSEWSSEELAMHADVVAWEVGAAWSRLPKRPDSGRRVLVNADAVNAAKRRLVEICRREFPSEKVFQHEPAEEIHPMSFAGRFIDDAGTPALKDAWYWLACYRDGWLYQQPFYAINPDQFVETP